MENKSNGGQIDVGVTRRWKRAGHQASTPRRVAVGWRAFGKMAPMVHTGIPTSVSSPSILSPLLVPSLPHSSPRCRSCFVLFFPFSFFRESLPFGTRFEKTGRWGGERREEGEERGRRGIEKRRREIVREAKVRKEVKKEKGTNPRG